MAYYERDYFREPERRVQASGPKLMPGGKFLLVFTILTFLIVWVMESTPPSLAENIGGSQLVKWLVVGPATLWPGNGGVGFAPWQILTGGLLERDLISLVLTSLILIWMIGSRIEEAVGTRRFLIFWFSSIVLGNLVGALIDPFVFSAIAQGELVQPVYTMGTIGVSTAMLAAAALLFPDARTFLDMKLATLVYVLIGLQMLIASFAYFGADAAQDKAIASFPAGIVGIFWGRLFVKAVLAKGIDTNKAKKRHLKRVENEPEDFIDYAKQFQVEEEDAEDMIMAPTLSRTEEKRLARETEERRKVDFLLARISGEGIDSLSRSEKAFLERYSKRQRETSPRP